MTAVAQDLRVARLAIVGAALSFLFVLLLPPTSATPDEAKYIGLGLNILEGNGLVTDFGVVFLLHAPLWPLILALPSHLFGADPLAVGHLLNAASGCVVILMTGMLAWRVRPVVGALAAIAVAGVTSLHALGRTAGLDYPAAACTMVALWLALRALDRESARLGLVAGLVLGIGFLFKETALPYLPVPFLVALVAGTRLVSVLRVGAAALLTFALSTSWWFALHAALSDKVYRLGTPGWTLGPIAALVVLIVLLGWGAQRVEASRLGARLTLLPSTVRRWWRPVLAWSGLAAWTLGQTLVYARTAKLAGAALIRPGIYLREARTVGPTLADALAFGIIGGLFALLLLRRSQATRELLFGFVAGIPLILLVVAIGESPRHYTVELALLVALGAAGWAHAVAAARTDARYRVALAAAIVVGIGMLLVRQPAATQVAVGIAIVVVAVLLTSAWLLARRAGAMPATATLLAIAIVGAAIPLAGWASRRHTSLRDARVEAVHTVGRWVDANVPEGALIAVGPALAYELAVEVRDDHRIVRISPDVAVGQRDAPFGLRWSNGSPVTDPLTMNVLPNIDQLDVFSATTLSSKIATYRPAAWVQAAYLPTGIDLAPPYAMFAAATGVTELGRWDFPISKKEHLVVIAYRIDPDTVAFDTSKVWIGPALPNLVRILEDVDARTGAAALVDRLVLTEDTPKNRALLEELRALGGRSTP